MKPNKAIEILQLYLKGEEPDYEIDLLDAVQLGIEALKRLNTMRGYCSPGSGPLLPGEHAIIDTTRSTHTIKKVLESPLGREPGS